MQSNERPFLYTVRWISAAIVTFGHALSLAFAIKPFGHGANVFELAVKYFADLGHAAVMLFFVISGYLVGGGVLQRLEKFSLSQYAISRFSRIYIALAPALIVTIVLDATAFMIDSQSPIYRSAWAGPIGHGAIFDGYTLQNIAATILSLENFLGEPFGSNRPLWSLGYEWVFYFVFPLLLLAFPFKKTPGLIKVAVVAIVASVVAVAFGRAFMALFWLIWVFGAVARELGSRGLVPRWAALIGGVVAFCAFAASPLIDHRIADPLIGLGFGLFVSRPSLLDLNINARADKYLADFSYSLYIVHMPVMTFLCFLLARFGLFSIARNEIGLRGLITWLFISAVSVFVAWVFGELFEKNTDALRRYISSLFNRVSRSSEVGSAN